ncbi:hypothetical protein KM043_016169 [Ampulex compressa]|nr:hypothetical protein KM043_016169 [Ampulex compressa]
MNQEAWAPCWVRGSRIEEIAWIGKDALAWCAGLCIIFFHVVQRRQTLKWCTDQENGDGAQCISGHATRSVFAYCEKIHNPRILVYAYPSMIKISECCRGCANGYLATAFTHHEHLVSMGFYPNFPMTIWSWKTGEKIIAVKTAIRDNIGQILRVTQTGLTYVAQMGKTCGKLFIWEVNIVDRVVILKDHEIKLPKDERIHWVDWCPAPGDALLAITDRDGHIFLSNYDGTNVYRIVLSQRCGVCLDIELPAVSWFRGGIILRTTFCQIRFFKKHPGKNTWYKEWYVKSLAKPCLLITHPFRSDRFFYHTLEGSLMQIDFPDGQSSPSIRKHLDYGAVYRYVDFVYPWCHHLAVTDDSKELAILESYSGIEVSRFDPESQGDISYQASHPDYPLIALASTQGELLLVSIGDPEAPKAIAYVHLQKHPLDLIKFSHSGRFLAAAEMKSGNCYCVKLQHDQPCAVMAQLRTGRSITDVSLHELRGQLKALVVHATRSSAVQRLHLYDVTGDGNLITEVTAVLNIPGVFRNLCHVPGNPQLLLGSPYFTRQLRLLRIEKFKDVALVDAMVTGHQERFAGRHARLPSGHETQESEISLSTVKIKGVHTVDYDLYRKLEEKILADYATMDSEVYQFLTRSKQVLPDSEERKTWVEWREDVRVQEETKACFEERAALIKDFEALKLRIGKLLDDNEAAPDIERLPVSTFDLDKVGRDQKLKAAKDEREDTRLELEHNCNAMDRVSNWIKTVFWDTQTVVGKSIFSLFGTKEVANYPSIVDRPHFQDFLHWAQYSRDSVRRIMESDTFSPWRVYTEEELREELNKSVKMYREDERRRMDILLEEEDREIDRKDIAELRSVEGMTTHRFVEQSPYYYSQMESYGFAHVMLNNCYLEHDCAKLRAYFNKVFEDVYALKEREMSVIRERTEKIRHIDSELKSMFDEHVPHIPANPEWHPKEKPESIIRVLDREVKAKPYVSPSQQEILDKQAAEAERIRQLLLADDFRERALMEMMDGVLEVRWEDVIKIDVPKPRCMLDKQPEQYTAEDFLVVKEYQKNVQSLQQERERYKRILESDYAKISGLLQEGIDKFNAKVEDLFQLKIKIESALHQLNLRYIRGHLRILKKAKLLEEEEQVKKKMTEKSEYWSTLLDHLKTFETVHQELVGQCEGLTSREKTLAKKFKSEFSSLGKAIVEILERYYKRRPRVSLKNVRASDLSDLAKCVAGLAQGLQLPVACIDYLRHLESLDVQPNTFPPNVETSHWTQLVRIRRQRIELELKIRAKQVDVAEAEQMIRIYTDKVNDCKLEINRLKDELLEGKSNRVIFEQDAEVQLVLKLGQVEIDLQGNRVDTSDSILIHKSQIEAVNELIRAAGSRKLDALKKTLDFRQRTMLKEWEHECLKMKCEDLKEDLQLLSSVNVTKDMQAYLMSEEKTPVKKSPRQLDIESEEVEDRFKKMLAKHVERLNEMKAKIEATRKDNAILDRKILEMNVSRCEMEHRRDLVAEGERREHVERRMRIIMRRSKMIRQLQKNYADLLALQTEHELLRLRRYPMLEFKTLEDDPAKKNRP